MYAYIFTCLSLRVWSPPPQHSPCICQGYKVTIVNNWVYYVCCKCTILDMGGATNLNVGGSVRWNVE